MRLRENNPLIPTTAVYSLTQIEETAYQNYVKTGEYLLRKHNDVTHPANLLDEVLNEFSKALEIRPDSADLQGRMARVWVKKGHYPKAETYAKKALKNNPNQPEAHYVLGYIAYKRDGLEESLKHLHQAVCHGGLKTSSYRFCLAYVYNALSEKSAGLSSLKRLSQVAYYIATGLPFMGLETERLSLSNLFKIIPSAIKAYQQEKGHDLDGALKELLKTHEAFPGLPAIQNMIGALYHNKGLREESSYWYRKAIHRNPLNEEGYLQLGRILEESGVYDVALEMYQKLLSLKPNNPEVHCSMGNVLYMSERFEEAIHYYRSAFQLSDDKPWKALLAQSMSKIYQDQFLNPEAAQGALQLAIELDPGDVVHYIHLGILHFETGDYLSAEKLYESALKIESSHPQLYSSLGYLKWMNDDIDEALRLYEKSVELDPFYDVPYNNMGVIYLDTLGNIPKAITLFEEAISLNENYALAHYNLGRAHSFLNNKLEAASAFRKTQRINDVTNELDNSELEDRIFKLFESQ